MRSLVPFFGVRSVYLGEGRALARTVFGHKLVVDTHDLNLAPHLLAEGRWEPGTTAAVLRRVSRGMRVVEVGANVGWYTVLLAQAVGAEGRVDAFEANPATFELLRRNVEINGMVDRVTLHQKAAMDRTGRVMLNVPERHLGVASVVGVPPVAEGCRQVEVDAVALDEELQGGPPVDLVKMDIEGSEPFALDGMRQLIARSPRMQIVVEFDPRWVQAVGRDPEKHLRSLEAQGFELQRITRLGRIRPLSVPEALELTLCDLLLTRRGAR
jgi:FkbM family methyltransferase